MMISQLHDACITLLRVIRFHVGGVISMEPFLRLLQKVPRTFGRRPSIFNRWNSISHRFCPWSAASNIYMLILGRVMLGVGVGFANQKWHLPSTGDLSISPSNLLRRVGVLSASLLNYGVQRSKVVGDGEFPWRGCSPTATFLTVGHFSPETANSLIQHGNDHQKAKQILQRVRGTTDVQAELDDLIKASDEINVISFYAPILFQTIGLGASASLMSAVVTGLVGTSATLLALLIVDRVEDEELCSVSGNPNVCFANVDRGNNGS
ncbi:hypothetical protein HAX54_007191 [Datura stramonium]|uniref:Uncharacterized protein n=1 Tax=Datura stramonium TaxID=4076 RepID=A0ABS8TCW9_DATST|nr:hypothetical protein [Datura stramonium]